MNREIDLKQLFDILRTHITAIVIAVFVAGMATFLFTRFFVTPMYTASVSMYVTNNNNRSDSTISSGDLTASQGLVDTYIVVLNSETLLSNISEQIPYGYTTKELRDMISAEAINDTEAFKVSVKNADPKAAQTIANTIASTAPSEIKRVVKAGSVEVIDYATLPQTPDWPVAKNSAIGALIGLMLSVLVIIIRAMFDNVIHTEEDLPEGFEIPVIGVIPGMEKASKRGGY